MTGMGHRRVLVTGTVQLNKPHIIPAQPGQISCTDVRHILLTSPESPDRDTACVTDDKRRSRPPLHGRPGLCAHLLWCSCDGDRATRVVTLSVTRSRRLLAVTRDSASWVRRHGDRRDAAVGPARVTCSSPCLCSSAARARSQSDRRPRSPAEVRRRRRRRRPSAVVRRSAARPLSFAARPELGRWPGAGGAPFSLPPPPPLPSVRTDRHNTHETRSLVLRG